MLGNKSSWYRQSHYQTVGGERIAGAFTVGPGGGVRVHVDVDVVVDNQSVRVLCADLRYSIHIPTLLLCIRVLPTFYLML